MLFPQVIDMQPLRLFYFGKMVKVLHLFFQKSEGNLIFYRTGSWEDFFGLLGWQNNNNSKF